MSQMFKVVLYSMITVSFTVMMFVSFAGAFFGMLDKFDVLAAAQGLPNLTAYWTTAGYVLRTGYWSIAVMICLGELIYIYQKSQEQEFVTAGGGVYNY